MSGSHDVIMVSHTIKQPLITAIPVIKIELVGFLSHEHILILCVNSLKIPMPLT